VFENRVLRRIFGQKRYKMVGGWRKLRNEKLHNLDSLLSICRMINTETVRWEVRVACTGVKGNEYRILVGKP
jgi:hypothetical protein